MPRMCKMRKPKRQYTRISNEDRSRIIDAAESGADVRSVATLLGIKMQTVYSIMDTGRREKLPRGGRKKVKIDDEVKEFCAVLLSENPFLTQREIIEHVQASLPTKPHFTMQALSCALDGMCYSVKLAPTPTPSLQMKHELSVGETADILETRYKFARWYMSSEAVTKQQVHCGAFGINVWTRRTNPGRVGIAPRSHRTYRWSQVLHGPNITCCVAVSGSLGLVHYQLYRGGLTREGFAEFLATTAAQMDGRRHLLVLADDTVPLVDSCQQYTVKRVPLITPSFSLAERAIACWKEGVKQELAGLQDEFLRPTAEQRGPFTMVEYRLQKVEAVLDLCRTTITCDKIMHWEKTLVDRCHHWLHRPLLNYQVPTLVKSEPE